MLEVYTGIRRVEKINTKAIPFLLVLNIRKRGVDVHGESGIQEEIVCKFPIKKRRFRKYLFVV